MGLFVNDELYIYVPKSCDGCINMIRFILVSIIWVDLRINMIV